MLKPEIRGLQAGDNFMWECAFHWLWPIAWAAAHRRLGQSHPADIEDVAISAIREGAEKVKAGEVSSFDELKALTAVIAHRRALDHLRRVQAERRSASATESVEGHEDLPSSAPGPLDEVDARELAKLLNDLAAKLPEQQRRLLLAYYFHGEKQVELAAKLGMPMGTVGVTLSRALAALRTELSKHPDLMKELLEALR